MGLRSGWTPLGAALVGLGAGLICACDPPRADDDSLHAACAQARADLGDWVHDDESVVPTAIEDPSGHAFDHAREAFARAARGEGQAHVVVYGGSHTAADLYVGTLRHALQAGFGDLGHGFVMPVPPFENYWQSGVRIAPSEGFASLEPSIKHMEVDAYGLAGMAFDADGPALAELRTEGSLASRITVLFLAQPQGGTLRLTVGDRSAEISTGTEGPPHAASLVVGVGDGSHALTLEALGDGPVRLYGVTLDREGSGVTVDQLGLAGAKARHQLLWSEPIWYELLASRQPDLIVLSYGNNETDDHHLADAEHVSHFEQALARMRRRFPGASCLILGPADRRLPDEHGDLVTPPLLMVLRQAQRSAAEAHGCAFFDVMGWQGGPGAMARWASTRRPLAREDGIHFTELGYRRLGAALGTAILDEIERLDAARLAPQASD